MPKPNPKTRKIKALLTRGEVFTTRDIADMTGASVQLVNHVRRQVRTYQAGASLKQNLEHLTQDVKDLRAFTVQLSAIVKQYGGVIEALSILLPEAKQASKSRLHRVS